MSKYWMIFALCGAIGCSGAPENADSSRDEVSDGAGTDKGKPDANAGTKGDDCGGTTTPSADPCATLISNTQSYLDEVSKTGDPALIAAAKEKYLITWSSCTPANEPGTKQPGKEDPGTKAPTKEDPGTVPPGTKDPGLPSGTEDPGTKPPTKDDPGTVPPKDEGPCAAALSVAAANLELAAKIGNIDLIIAVKDKYAAVAASCAPPATEAPPKK